MKVISVVGGRPNLIKLSAVHTQVSGKFNHLILHTGQHYDLSLSQKFFKELKIPNPNKNLNVGSDTQARQTGRILTGCEKYFIEQKPDFVIVYGDMNSTLAAALAAVKLHIPIAHVEAGIRCFDKKVPEEVNRVVTDQVSDLLLTPTINAQMLLKKENLGDKAFFCGDVTYDVFLKVVKKIKESHLTKKNLAKNQYYFVTIHRAENTDDKKRFERILKELQKLDLPIVLPLHPRTKKMIDKYNLKTLIKNIKIIEPVTYTQSLSLQNYSRAIITDSGGIQKESYFLKKPCITLRDSTEWPETVTSGYNQLFFPDKKPLAYLVNNLKLPKRHPQSFGNGQAGQKIVQAITKFLKTR